MSRRQSDYHDHVGELRQARIPLDHVTDAAAVTGGGGGGGDGGKRGASPSAAPDGLSFAERRRQQRSLSTYKLDVPLCLVITTTSSDEDDDEPAEGEAWGANSALLGKRANQLAAGAGEVAATMASAFAEGWKGSFVLAAGDTKPLRFGRKWIWWVTAMLERVVHGAFDQGMALKPLPAAPGADPSSMSTPTNTPVQQQQLVFGSAIGRPNADARADARRLAAKRAEQRQRRALALAAMRKHGRP